MKVLFTGGSGMLGQAVQRLAPELAAGWRLFCPRRAECDLRDKQAVRRLLSSDRFDLVIHAAATVAGIAANITDPVGFLLENMEMNMNVISESARTGMPSLIFIGSSCMYPRDYLNPLREEYLLAAPLEPTNEGYALSKIAGAKLCEYISRQEGFAYKTLIPCNLYYGPGDDFDPSRSHLVAAVLRKLHEAKSSGAPYVEIWGDGSARREFLFVEDLAVFIVGLDPGRVDALPDYLNLGCGTDHSVLEYYEIGASVVGYSGAFRFNLDAPVGMHRKLLDSSRAAKRGWTAPTDLETGMRKAYAHFLALQEASERASSAGRS